MDKELIAEMGVEGGGLNIFGTKSENVWLSWSEGTTIDLDEDDDETGRAWSSEPVSRLDLVVPSDWPLFHPMEIHRDFLEWFRDAYKAARAILP